MEYSYCFEDQELNKDYLTYLHTRNEQIVEWKKSGKTWAVIAMKVGLSKDYVKDIGHKYGVFGPTQKFTNPRYKPPKRELPRLGQRKGK